MSLLSVIILRAFLAASLASLTEAKGFLGDRSGALRKLDAAAFQNELRQAMGEALGCGGQLGAEQLATVEQGVLPIWHSLPKNGNGRIERRSLRYLVHRYFNKKSSLVIRGFEPSRTGNATGADILSQRVPSYVESALESQHAAVHGFDLRDATYMVATIEQLIVDSEAVLLENVYKEHHKPLERPLSDKGLSQVLEDYMVHWMMGDDAEGIEILLQNRSLLATAFPHWDELVAFAHGQISNAAYQRETSMKTMAQPGQNAFSRSFSFEDARGIVGGITRSFASFWDSECISMRASLIDMDSHGTGRVPLAKFYSTALETEWRFGESESYLREMGALDETSWRGKQVIIPNYMQAASNCIVSTPHYLVCCMNECEGILADIEVAVGAPVASAPEILSLVGNMSAPVSLEDDELAHLDAALVSQLEQIAAANGGKVPLHGRLFSQWLHYVFPRACPFPHKAGTAALVTPSQFGDKYIASDEEMRSHASSVNSTEVSPQLDKEELQWMSQWSPEEELFADYSAGELPAPWDSSLLLVGGGAALAVAALLGAVSFSRKSASSSGLLPTHSTSKSHFV